MTITKGEKNASYDGNLHAPGKKKKRVSRRIRHINNQEVLNDILLSFDEEAKKEVTDENA